MADKLSTLNLFPNPKEYIRQCRINNLEKEIEKLKDEILSLEDQISEYEHILKKNEKYEDLLRNDIQCYKEENRILNDQINEKIIVINSLKESNSKNEQKINCLVKELQEKTETISIIENELSKYKQTTDSLNVQLKSTIEENESLSKMISSINENNNILEKELTIIKSDNKTLASSNKELQLTIDTLQHRIKESDDIRDYPIRETVFYFDNFISSVYNDVIDSNDLKQLKKLFEARKKHLFMQLKGLQYKIYCHERNCILDSNYICDEPSFSKCGDLSKDNHVKSCDLFGISFPNDFITPILSKITLIQYDESIKSDIGHMDASLQSFEELDAIVSYLYYCIDTIDTGHFDETIPSLPINYYTEDYNKLIKIYKSLPKTITDSELMNFLFYNNPDIFIRLSLTVGVL